MRDAVQRDIEREPFSAGLNSGGDRKRQSSASSIVKNTSALDPYVFTRESFLQYRNHLINDDENSDAYDLALEDTADLNAGKTITTEPFAG